MFNFGLKKDAVITHDQICRKAKCGCIGGIRYSKQNNVLVLFINSNSQYENAWDGEMLKYMGTGRANQSIEAAGNMHLAEATKTKTAVYLFERVDSISCRYIGRMELVKTPYYEMHKNKDGINERKVIFVLKKVE